MSQSLSLALFCLVVVKRVLFCLIKRVRQTTERVLCNNRHTTYQSALAAVTDTTGNAF